LSFAPERRVGVAVERYVGVGGEDVIFADDVLELLEGGGEILGVNSWGEIRGVASARAMRLGVPRV